ncbi:MAG: dephospho-CoA kinase [Clostridiales bacterium]|nr:dephospho-CoA kinase [Clostridiales bacterium]
MTVIGLTGNIGAGKSLVREILVELGAQAIDADLIAKELSEPGRPAYEQIKLAFGSRYFAQDGALERRFLGELVFSRREARLLLNEIMHPLILREAGERLQALKKAGAGLIVVEAALLPEIGLGGLADEVWLVEAPDEEKIARVCQRDGLNPEEAARRLDTQMTEAQTRPLAKRIINNSGSVEQLREIVTSLFNELSAT